MQRQYTQPCSLVVLIAVLSAIGVAEPMEVRAQTLQIYHIDVEQGDATLFVSPHGRTLLVDSGKNGHGNRIRAVMDQAGVSRIDHFVATHYHEDHFGGIDELVNAGIEVGTTYDRGDKDFLPASKRNQETFAEYQSAVGQESVHLMRGETIPLDSTMLVTCIASGGVVLGEQDPRHGVDENDMSVTLLVQYGAFRYFVGGDIEQSTEDKIAARDLLLDVDVYRANHHGSHTSSSQALLEDLQPTVVVISNGNHGVYEHPRRSTLDRLDDLSPTPAVFQTNKYLQGGEGGNVEDAFIADPESSDEDGTIRIDVELSDSAFHVSYRDTTLSFAINRRSSVEPIVVIERLLPDPVGSDWDGEEIALRNDSQLPVSLTGWLLRDRTGRVWTLSGVGTLRSGQSVIVRRDRMPMSLNNGGDEISLIDAAGVERDSCAYSGSVEGEWIETGH